MLGRRLYHRHLVADAKGTLYVPSDVTVQRQGDKELIATSDEAHVQGEKLAIELVNGTSRERVYVRVEESCPILMDGSIRHRLRLIPCEDSDI